jgi:two-component system nitrogen regulation sensor histidine kinase NtrY
VIGHPVRWWRFLLGATALSGTEWLHAYERPWAWAAGIGALATIALLLPAREWSRRALILALVLLAVVIPLTQRSLDRIDHDWEGVRGEREALVKAAGDRLGGDLRSAFQLTQELADVGAAAAERDRDAAFRILAQATRSQRLESGIAILEADGTPWAWAGSHRLPPRAEGDSITSASSQYYVTLESRRHSGRGRIAVANVLVWAHPAVPDRAGSLAERFRASTDVALAVYQPDSAPDNRDVFDYCEPTTAGRRCLFSAQPLPPVQADARALEVSRGGRAAAIALLMVLVLALAVEQASAGRWMFAVLAVWLIVHAPVGSLLGAGDLFSPASYLFSALLPLTSSAGTLGLFGALMTMGAVWLWRRRLRRRWWSVLAGVALFLAVPFGVSALSGGITPPADGTPLGLWLSWQLSLFLVTAGPIVLASALIRGDAEPRRSGWWSWLGVAAAIFAGVVGLYTWQPGIGWPAWFPLLWAPVLLVAGLPLPTGQAVASIALAAGSLSSLLTWQAEQSGRMLQAQREVFRLGGERDPVAPALLELFGNAVREAPPPVTATELYVLWRTSVLAEQGYPARLALWAQGVGWGAELALDSLEIGRPELDSMLSSFPRPDSVVTLLAPPGLHYMLTTPLSDGRLLVTVIGPQTQLITPSRLGRLLEPTVHRPPSYVLALSPPMTRAAPTATLLWQREGWVLRAVRTLSVAGTTRDIYVQTTLRGPVPLLVRGAVLLIIDILVLALVWLMADYCGHHRIHVGPWRTAARSFRVRLAVTLAVFFLVPTVGFSVWGIQRLALGTARVADALISGTLRDALRSSGVLATRDSAYGAHELEALGQRMDADFGLYGGGRLTAASARILQDLGVLGELMDPDAFRQLAFGGQLEVTRDGPLPTLAERVGYRLLLPGSPSHLGVLATPRRVGELNTDTQQDLAMALLLVLMLGLAAALLGAQSAARALSRPVADLRLAALALGEGKPAPLQDRSPPSEFEPVFGAFNRMAADVRASREALEAARRRTETVLATVATGVIAVDPAGRVLLANRQAEQMLHAQLTEGVVLRDHLGSEWAPLVTQVEEALASRSAADVPVEHSAGGRRISAQHARLAGPLGGVVVALTDVTDMSRAERVLAWGEMARQVAHEIKNPLTPMRLGMQHLQRAWQDGRGDYDRILTETSDRMLGEIDRLDRIARAFSRFVAPGDAQQPSEPLEPIDVVSVAREVVHLYDLSDAGARVTLEAPASLTGRARPDELKEVLVNVLENARNAGATLVRVTIEAGRIVVADDGSGIPPDALPRVFEPHFSTNTSGSGLGLSIVKRLVESWGGAVAISSAVGRGTTITIRYVPA